MQARHCPSQSRVCQVVAQGCGAATNHAIVKLQFAFGALSIHGTAARWTQSYPKSHDPNDSNCENPVGHSSYKEAPIRSLASSSFSCFNLHSPLSIYSRHSRSYHKSNGPHIKDFVRLHSFKQLTDNYNTTSLTTTLLDIMVSSNVNRTTLHPHGIQYVYCSRDTYIYHFIVIIADF
jgi:hypothetical protein